MAAITMKSNKEITVLVNPTINSDGELKFNKGVYLTRNYINPSGELPEENIFINYDEKWFYWLGYNNDFQSIPAETEENKKIIQKILDYTSNKA